MDNYYDMKYHTCMYSVYKVNAMTVALSVVSNSCSLNRDEGVELHDCWMAAVRKFERRNQHHHGHLNVPQPVTLECATCPPCDTDV